MCEIHVCWVLTWCLQCELNEVSKSECSRQEGDEIHYAIPLRKRQYNFWYCILVVFDKTSFQSILFAVCFPSQKVTFLVLCYQCAHTSSCLALSEVKQMCFAFHRSFQNQTYNKSEVGTTYCCWSSVNGDCIMHECITKVVIEDEWLWVTKIMY